MHITAENVPEETVSLSDEDSKQPEDRNRRAEQNRRRKLKWKDRRRKAQGTIDAKVTHEAEGAKARGAVETSYGVAHEPDPLYPTVDGDAKEQYCYRGMSILETRRWLDLTFLRLLEWSKL